MHIKILNLIDIYSLFAFGKEVIEDEIPPVRVGIKFVLHRPLFAKILVLK